MTHPSCYSRCYRRGGALYVQVNKNFFIDMRGAYADCSCGDVWLYGNSDIGLYLYGNMDFLLRIDQIFS